MRVILFLIGAFAVGVGLSDKLANSSNPTVAKIFGGIKSAVGSKKSATVEDVEYVEEE